MIDTTGWLTQQPLPTIFLSWPTIFKTDKTKYSLSLPFLVRGGWRRGDEVLTRGNALILKPQQPEENSADIVTGQLFASLLTGTAMLATPLLREPPAHTQSPYCQSKSSHLATTRSQARRWMSNECRIDRAKCWKNLSTNTSISDCLVLASRYKKTLKLYLFKLLEVKLD